MGKFYDYVYVFIEIEYMLNFKYVFNGLNMLFLLGLNYGDFDGFRCCDYWVIFVYYLWF